MISTSGYEHYQYGAGGELVKRFSRSGSEFYSNVEIDGLFQYNNRLNVATDHQNKINVLDSSGNTVAQRRLGSALGEAAYASDELYMLHNHTGSIIGTYDLNGAQQEGEDFYPFGETAHNWNGNKTHRFGGKLRSFSSGFYLFGARQYAPWLAKFTSVDPLAHKYAHLNPYNYASNNPVTHKDIDGMQNPAEPSSPAGGNAPNSQAEGSGDNNIPEIFDDKKIHFIQKSTGKYLGSMDSKDGKTSYRSVGSKEDFEAIKGGNPYASVEGDSSEITIDYENIRSNISKIVENSTRKEGGNLEDGLSIVLDIQKMTISSVLADPKDRNKGSIDFKYDKGPGNSSFISGSKGNLVILATVHTHPPDSSKLDPFSGTRIMGDRYFAAPGMSKSAQSSEGKGDDKLAKDMNATAYAIGLFGGTGGKQDVYYVGPNGDNLYSTSPLTNVKENQGINFLIHDAIRRNK